MKIYMLLDRSGSMNSKWAETLTSVNTYVHELAKQAGVSAEVTLAAFDQHAGSNFDLLREDIDPANWVDISDIEATPRGGTPLLDALGKLIALAEDQNPAKAVFVIMTDGEENSSSEFTKDNVEKALDRCRAKGWEDVWLGCDFNNVAQAHSLGSNAARSVGTTMGNYAGTMRMMAMKTMAYGHASSQLEASSCMDWSDNERHLASTDGSKLSSLSDALTKTGPHAGHAPAPKAKAKKGKGI